MSDCGLYAIAFAMAIFNEMRPEELLFDEKHMRPHLKACLLDGQMRHAFPMQKEDHQEQNQKGGGTGGVLYLQAVRVWQYDFL